MARIFLSHSSKDKVFVRRLGGALRAAGHHAWIDEAEIGIGDSLLEKISQGLAESDYVVAVISKASVESNWVTNELIRAMRRENSGASVHVLPVVLNDCEIPFFLRDKVYADFRDESHFDVSLSRLLLTIAKHVEIDGQESGRGSAQPPPVPIEPVAQNGSIALTTNVGTLLKMKDARDLRLGKIMGRCRTLTITYAVAGMIGYILLLWIVTNNAGFAHINLLELVTFFALIAAVVNFAEGGFAYLLLQHDKQFAVDIELLRGGMWPFGRNWRTLFLNGRRRLARALFLLAYALDNILPFIVALCLAW